MAVNKERDLRENKRRETMEKIISEELPSNDVFSNLNDEIKLPPKGMCDQ
jgi:hypothetical protein